MKKLSNYREFCESMTAAMNLYALMHADSFVTVEQVMAWPEAEKAYQATICIIQTAI